MAQKTPSLTLEQLGLGGTQSSLNLTPLSESAELRAADEHSSILGGWLVSIILSLII